MSETYEDLLYAAVAFVCGLFACMALGPATMPITLDNQVYFFIAERAASGVPPHVSEFDPKNALSILASAAALHVGRIFEVEDLMAGRALSIVVTAACFALTWLATRMVSGSRVAASLAVTALVTFPGFLSLGTMGFRPKSFLIFFLLCSVLAVGRRAWFGAGLLCAACFLTWQPALITFGAAGVVLLARKDRVGGIAKLCAGLFAAIVLYEFYFWTHGALLEQLYQSLVFPTEHTKPSWGPAKIAQQLFNWERGFAPATAVMTVFGVAIVLGWLGAAASVFRGRLSRSAGGPLGRIAQDQPALAYVFIAGSASVAFLITDYQGFPDRFLVAPFAAVIAASALALVWRPVEARLRGRAFDVCGAALALLLAWSAFGDISRSQASYSLEVQRAAAAKVRASIDSGLSVYAMGPLHLLALNGEANFSPYGYFPWRVRARFHQQHLDGERWKPLRDGELPDIVLESRIHFSLNLWWLRPNYRLAPWPIMGRQGVRRWVRKRADDG